MRTQRTYCRICEAHCGLEVSIDEQEQVLSIKPDKAHPVSKGYACIKGTSIGALHDDPDRINYPLKRIDGELKRISWEQAISEIGEKVKNLRQRHGDRCIAMYQGNPTYFSFQNIMYSSAFLEALHSPNMFASHSIDANNKFETSTHIYGRSMVHPVADLEKTQFFMCFGSNPSVSQMSVMQVINPLQQFKDIEARGGQVIFVDPRETETSSKVGSQLFIKPGTDVYLLMAMLHVIAQDPKLELKALETKVNGLEAFLAMAQDWSPERVETITGIDAEQIRGIASDYLNAEGAALYMSTGLNMGPFGSLCYWLIQGLNLITGNLDKEGGLLFPRGAFDAVKLAEMLGLGGFDEHQTLVDKWHRVAGCFPASALADEINVDHPEAIRALFISAGNPVHSVPQGQAIGEAFEKLELLVSVDIYQNESAAYADYILPATDMLERSDYPVSHMVLQTVPHAQYTPAVVAPKHERRPEWQIYSELAMACGAKALGPSLCNVLPHLNHWLSKIPIVGKRLGSSAIHPDTLLKLLLRWGGKVSLNELIEKPEGVLLGRTQAGSFIGKRVPTKDGKVQLWPTKLANDLKRMALLSEQFVQTGDQLQLIGQRDRRSHNSWMHNNAGIKHPQGNSAIMHQEDAKLRGIEQGDLISVRSSAGSSVELPVQIGTKICQGVIAVPHGWGHESAGLSKASALPGCNINTIIPGGSNEMEPVSGQAIMLAHFVDVARVSSGAPRSKDKKTMASA